MPAEPTEDQYWAVPEIAKFLRITESSVRVYVARGDMPTPDHRFGATNVWKPATIRKWHAGRPRKGSD